MKVIFVCTGNTCRSPMAEGFGKSFNRKYSGDIEIISRGVMTREGGTVHKYAVTAMANYSIDISDHKTKPLKQFDIDDDTILLGMTKNHIQYINENFMIDDYQIFTLEGYAGDEGDISDPFGMTQSVYNSCATEIREAVEASIKKMLNIK